MRGRPATAGQPPARVVRAGAADLDALSQVIADAFHDLPQSRWLISDPAARRQVFPGYFRLLAEHALASGTVHTTTDRAAAALWLPAGLATACEPEDYQDRLADITGPWLDRFLAFDAILERRHLTGVPHEHLAILAVHPSRQGQGIGSILLRARHHQLDHGAGTLAYLQAATRQAVRLYERHGYALTPTAPFRLPERGPLMWSMTRRPAPCEK